MSGFGDEAESTIALPVLPRPKADIGLAGQHVVRGLPYLPDYPALLYYPAMRDPGLWGIGCNSINYITLLSGATAPGPFVARVGSASGKHS